MVGIQDIFSFGFQCFLHDKISLCDESLRELSNPGASGSIFYLTRDDEFILKTVGNRRTERKGADCGNIICNVQVSMKEAEFLQKILPGYYMNLHQNPRTLLPKFFGMFTYQVVLIGLWYPCM